MHKFASTRLLNWCNIQVLTHCFLAFDRGPEKFALHLSTKYKFHLKAGWHDTPGKATYDRQAKQCHRATSEFRYREGRASSFVPPFFRKRKKHLIPAQDSLIKEFNRSDHLLKLGGGKQNGLSFYIAK